MRARCTGSWVPSRASRRSAVSIAAFEQAREDAERLVLQPLALRPQMILEGGLSHPDAREQVALVEVGRPLQGLWRAFRGEPLEA
jgi:hypothetical protein